jgi:hypothetical protein
VHQDTRRDRQPRGRAARRARCGGRHLAGPGWGKPAQAHTGENGEGAITVLIRHITEGGEQHRPLQIDTKPVKTGDQNATNLLRIANER